MIVKIPIYVELGPHKLSPDEIEDFKTLLQVTLENSVEERGPITFLDIWKRDIEENPEKDVLSDPLYLVSWQVIDHSVTIARVKELIAPVSKSIPKKKGRPRKI